MEKKLDITKPHYSELIFEFPDLSLSPPYKICVSVTSKAYLVNFQTLNQEMLKHCLTTQLGHQKSFPLRKATLSEYLKGLTVTGGTELSMEQTALFLRHTSVCRLTMKWI